MHLYEAAISCRVYAAFGGEFDDSLREFVVKTGGTLNLESDESGAALMKWLNEWGCRQFAKECHQDALNQIRAWASRSAEDLPFETKSILQLTDAEIQRIAAAYDELKELQASQRRTARGTVSVRVGATGAAKILYAMRPHALPPWDDAIRGRLKCDGSAHSYNRFIQIVTGEIQELLGDAAVHGVSPEQLPAILGRGASTLPKIPTPYARLGARKTSETVKLSRFGVRNQFQGRPKLLITRAFRPLPQILQVGELFRELRRYEFFHR